MRVLVIGAGIVGVATAHYLAEQGHEVVVVDRASGPAGEASFANAGGMCPSFAGPWATPAMPLNVLRWMFREAPPLKFRPRPDPRQWQWLARFLANCTTARFKRNKTRMQRIAHYSHAKFRVLRDGLGLAFDGKQAGILQIFRTGEEMAGGERAAGVLAELGIAHALVTGRECLAIEPGLTHATVEIRGGLRLPNDEIGDCHLFARGLAENLEARGVAFYFDTPVRRLLREGDAVVGVETGAGVLRADAYVVAAGAYAPLLLAPLGIRLPIYPVKGYSITAGIVDPDAAPAACVMDEHSKVMISRLGNRLRCAGVAEVAGFDPTLHPAQIAGVKAAARALFPRGGDYDRASAWAGFRPMTPDGPPYLGKAGLKNLFLNAGQGSNGWTQACGCGQVLADLVSGRTPEIDLDGLTYTTH